MKGLLILTKKTLRKARNEPCAIWYVDSHGLTTFEGFDSEAEAITWAKRNGSPPSDTVLTEANTNKILGIQFGNGDIVPFSEWNVEVPEDDKTSREGREVVFDTPQPKTLIDPFTGAEVKVWVVPQWMENDE